jgi:hypothetical protein
VHDTTGEGGMIGLGNQENRGALVLDDHGSILLPPRQHGAMLRKPPTPRPESA